MASSKEYLDYVLNQCGGLSARSMMGEYLLYYDGKLVGGIYDNRLLIKPTQAAIELLPLSRRELPYDGAKEMLLVEDVENRELLKKLFEAMYDELPEPKKKTTKK
ncbi:MAG: TfoX/Sxy family protein [Clostridia bacterium]|nr:TfoX/Sxy family protein [Clostridia bacterium]